MKRTISFVALVALAGFVGVSTPLPVSAQLADASATTLGLSGNNTATARGLAAISVNPAGLAMPGSGFSLAFFATQVRLGSAPISLTDLKDVQGILIPATTRADWLALVSDEGGEGARIVMSFGNRDDFLPYVTFERFLDTIVTERDCFGGADQFAPSAVFFFCR